MKTTIITAMLAAALTASAQNPADGYSKYIQAVDEYMPAPGQFVNTMPLYEEGDNAESMARKCTEAIADNAGGMVCLGAYGGYITFHFDHSIANIEGQRDFYIAGNAFREMGTTLDRGSSEPGIVMVMRDDNGNGLPDDQWFELQGSVDTDSLGMSDYTYYIIYARASMQDIPWTDSQGRSGIVPRNAFHAQEYYPLWVEQDELTFSGTLLPPNGYATDEKGRTWTHDFLRYGYADNRPNTDSLGCSFDISWAVDSERQPVQLDRIDFVRVYTAVNQVCGLQGEVSTEVAGAEDLHLEASIEATVVIPMDIEKQRMFPNGQYSKAYNMMGQPIGTAQGRQSGLQLLRLADGTVRKVMR